MAGIKGSIRVKVQAGPVKTTVTLPAAEVAALPTRTVDDLPPAIADKAKVG